MISVSLLMCVMAAWCAVYLADTLLRVKEKKKCTSFVVSLFLGCELLKKSCGVVERRQESCRREAAAAAAATLTAQQQFFRTCSSCLVCCHLQTASRCRLHVRAIVV